MHFANIFKLYEIFFLGKILHFVAKCAVKMSKLNFYKTCSADPFCFKYLYFLLDKLKSKFCQENVLLHVTDKHYLRNSSSEVRFYTLVISKHD